MLEHIPKVSLEKIYSLLPSKEKSQSQISDLIELEITKNEQFVRKRFFKLKIKNHNIIHLTCGKNLENTYENTKSFHSTFPSISCRPLFFVKNTEIDLLAQEFFDGEEIDKYFDNNRINEDDVKDILEIIKKEFFKQTKSSNQDACAKEFTEFSDSILKNKKINKLDKVIIQNYLLPNIENGLLIKRPMIRLSSGDLSARNILVNKNKDFRIIDCEFAHKTHFFDEDWIRLATFCSNGFRQIPYIQNMVQYINPLLHSYLRLRQTLLNQKVFSDEESDFVLCDDLVNSILSASNISKDTNISKPIILKGFENSINQSNHELNELKYQNKSQEKDLYTKNKELNSLRNKNLLNITKLKSINEELILEKKENEKKVDDLIKEKKHSLDLQAKINKLENIVTHKISLLNSLKSENIANIKELESTREKLLLEKQMRERKQNQIDKQKSLILTKINQLKDEKDSNFLITEELEETKQNLNKTYSNLEVAKDKIRRMEISFSWKCTSILRLLRRTTIDRYKVHLQKQEFNSQKTKINPTYDNWVRYFDTLSVEYLNNLSQESEAFSKKPTISILMPVFNPNIEYLKQAIKSVLNQTYRNWELCIADDASDSKSVLETLKEFSSSDKRIKVCLSKHNNHISACSNLAASKVTGEFIALLDHDDLLRPHALHFLVKAINLNKEPVLIYSDEDKIDELNRRFSPFFKTDWNPELLRSQNYICHFTAIKTEHFRSLDGFREGFEGSQDWDLFLRATEKLNRKNIIHIPKILYHWRATSVSTAASSNNKDYSKESALKALKEHHYRTKSGGKTKELDSGYFMTHYHSSKDLKSTIIIPTRNGNEVLQRCLSSIYKYTNQSDFEIIIIDNGSDCKKTKNLLLNFKKRNKNLFIIEDDSIFNFSALNNNAVKRSNHNIVVFLNDDTEILCNNWLNELMSNAIRPEIGAVGGKLLYPNGTIQHAGVILGVGGVAGHGFRTMARETPEQMNRANIAHNLSAVTGACLAVEKSKFIKVGGFDEKYLKVAFNDVDLCLKLMKEGYENLYLPQVIIKHHESYSRGLEDTQEKQLRFNKETETMKKRWGKLLLNDPYYNENFSLDSEQFQLTGKPRV